MNDDSKPPDSLSDDLARLAELEKLTAELGLGQLQSGIDAARQVYREDASEEERADALIEAYRSMVTTGRQFFSSELDKVEVMLAETAADDPTHADLMRIRSSFGEHVQALTLVLEFLDTGDLKKLRAAREHHSKGCKAAAKGG